MTARRISYVDVFTSVPFAGNPVAVVLDADGLSTEQMQTIARWTNLSETTFVVPSQTADFGVRIFTTRTEYPFAGHPTVGTTHAVLEAGVVDRADELTMECLAGIVRLGVAPNGAVTAATPRTNVLDDVANEAAVAAAVGPLVARTLVIDAGPLWMVAQVGDAAAVRDLRPDMGLIGEALEGTSGHGLTVYGIEADGGADMGVEVRSLIPGDSSFEDPVCGSGNAAVGRHLEATGGLVSTGASYVARQGRPIGRDGYISVDVTPDVVSIGGHAVTIVEGHLST